MNNDARIHRTLQALNANRTPGWQFPAHYLGLSFEHLRERHAEVTMRVGPHCVDADQVLSLEALGVFADVAMAGAVRTRMGSSARVATVSLRLSLGMLPQEGDARAAAELSLNEPGSAMHMTAARLSIYAGNSLCCTGEGIRSRSGSFVSWRQCRMSRANEEVVQTFPRSLEPQQHWRCSVLRNERLPLAILQT